MARLDFANARLGARRARVAAAPFLRELLTRPSLEARLELLRGAQAGAALPDEPGPDPLAGIERGLREGLRREGLALLHDAEGPRARGLLGAFLSLDEATAVKAVLRGVARGSPIDRTLAGIPPVPGIADEGLRAAAAKSTLEGAVEALAAAGSGLAPALHEALPRVAAGGLLELEIAADRAAIARGVAACRHRGEDGAVLSRHLADLADARNAATLLALRGVVPVSRPWVPSGRRWTEPALDALARSGADAAVAAISRAFAIPAAQLARPWTAERALERACVTALARAARSSPLSLAVPLAYLAARRQEIRGIALALHGAELGIPADELLDLVEA